MNYRFFAPTIRIISFEVNVSILIVKAIGLNAIQAGKVNEFDCR